jgi:2-polyprenyl-3-methyl-5-hydroxy-6-metoxy-1,4-benzoquinol methylase
MIRYTRQPIDIDGIEVFLPRELLAQSDEYQDGNPYRDETVKESKWDRFRVQTILDATTGVDVLDMGSGEGELTAVLAKKHRVEGMDYSVSAVRLARRLVPEAHFIVADAQDPPYCDGQFDTVVMGNLFEHVESPCRLLRAAHRLLKPDGRLVISTPSRYKTGSFRRAMTGRKIILNSTHHVTEYTVGQVDEILRWCGFTLVSAKSNLNCRTMLGTAMAHAMQFSAKLLGSHTQFGDPTIYMAHRSVAQSRRLES